MNITPERWKWVKGYRGRYKISNRGRVKSTPRVVDRQGHNTRIRYLHKGKILAQSTNKNHKYLTLRKGGINDPAATKPVHLMVLEAFVGPRPKGRLGCHRNGKGFDNRLENLYWGTRAEDRRDMIRHGKAISGSKSRIFSVGKIDARKIYKLYKSGNYTQAEIAERMGTAVQNVNYIVAGRNWKYSNDDPEPLKILRVIIEENLLYKAQAKLGKTLNKRIIKFLKDQIKPDA